VPVTLHDIAERVGLSRTAVSYALRGSDQVADHTRKRVLRVADEMGYRPNASARAIRTGKFAQVALLLSTHYGRSHVPSGLLSGVHDALAEREMQLSLVKLPDEKLTDAGFVPRILREWSCDGLIVNYTDHIPDKMIDLIERSRHAAVWLNTQRDHDCVYPDDFGGLRDATARAIALGHRRLAYVDYAPRPADLPTAHSRARDRQAGHQQAMREAGLSPRVIRGERVVPSAERLALTESWLAAADRPTAVLGCSPMSVVVRAADRLGLRLGTDLSMVFVDVDTAHAVAVEAPARVGVAWSDVGRLAVEMLAEKIAAPSRRPAPGVVPCVFHAGQTLGPAPGN
jgi:LacI family transcriptional regulator